MPSQPLIDEPGCGESDDTRVAHPTSYAAGNALEGATYPVAGGLVLIKYSARLFWQTRYFVQARTLTSSQIHLPF